MRRLQTAVQAAAQAAVRYQATEGQTSCAHAHTRAPVSRALLLERVEVLLGGFEQVLLSLQLPFRLAEQRVAGICNARREGRVQGLHRFTLEGLDQVL